MAKRNLSRRWLKWRRQRYWELAAAGLPRHVAWDTAKGESAARQRAARVYGMDAATEADLTCLERDGKPVFVLIGDMPDPDATRRRTMPGKFAEV